MSLSQPVLANPSARTFQWAGSRGALEWYDRDNQRRVPVRFPFQFIVLDELSCIVGFNKLDNSAYWSNEVRNVSKEPFTVKTARGVKQVGLYKELADVRSKGAKYAKSIYIAHKDQTGHFVIGNFKASGSALTAWIELSKSGQVDKSKIVLERGEKQTAPTGEYYPPLFKLAQYSDEELEEAVALDKQLQEYLSHYLSQQASEQASMFGNDDSEIDPEIGKATPEQIADFERRKAAGLSRSNRLDLDTPPAKPDTVITDIGDEPVNLDDIPF